MADGLKSEEESVATVLGAAVSKLMSLFVDWLVTYTVSALRDWSVQVTNPMIAMSLAASRAPLGRDDMRHSLDADANADVNKDVGEMGSDMAGLRGGCRISIFSSSARTDVFKAQAERNAGQNTQQKRLRPLAGPSRLKEHGTPQCRWLPEFEPEIVKIRFDSRSIEPNCSLKRTWADELINGRHR